MKHHCGLQHRGAPPGLTSEAAKHELYQALRAEAPQIKIFHEDRALNVDFDIGSANSEKGKKDGQCYILF